MSYLYLSESALLDRTVGARWPGARAEVWIDYRTFDEVFRIKFSNGNLVDGADRTDVCRRADAHANAIKRLTGKYP